MVIKTLGILLISSVLLAPPSAFASKVETVLPGTDQWSTQPGTYINFGVQPEPLNIGVVKFVGLPIYPDGADTLIERPVDAVINGPPIPIQLLKLSWQSAAPVYVNGTLYDVTGVLDPVHLAEDVGTMSIMGSSQGGTFTAQMDVFLLFHFVARTDPPNCCGKATIPEKSFFDVFVELPLLDPDGTWKPRPSNIPNEVYLFPAATTFSNNSGIGQIVLSPVPTPEPGTLLLCSGGAVALLRRVIARISRD